MKIFLPLLGFFFSIQAFSQNTSFVRLMVNDSSEHAQSGFQLSSGDYFLLFNTNSSGQGKKDFGITRTDGLGNVKWSYTYGKSNNDSATQMKPTSDGGAIVCGYSEGSLNDKDGFVSKVASDGTLQWSRSFKTDSSEQIFDVIQSFAGDYYACGYSEVDSLDENILISRLNTNGTVSWTRSFGGEGNDRGHSLLQDNRGRIIIAGYSENDSVNIGSDGDRDFQLLAVSTAGNLLLSRNIGTNNSEHATKIIKSQDNKFYVGGNINFIGGVGIGTVVLKLDTNFNLLNNYSFKSMLDDNLRDMKLSDNNSVLLAVSSISEFSSNPLIIKMYSNGNILDGQNLGDIDFDGKSGISLMGSETKGYSMFTSGTSLGNTSTEDLYITKIPSSFTIECNSFIEPIQKIGGLSFSSDTFSLITPINSNASVSFTKKKFSSKDSVVCCKLEAKVNGDSLRICSGTSINIGRSSISGYKYSWTTISGASFSSNSANPRVSPKVDTEYKLVVSSSNGLCKSDSATILVRVNPRMSQEFLSDTFFCEGSSVTIDGLKGMLFYEWERKSTGKKSNNNSISLSTPDTLNLLMLDNNTCRYLDTIIVEQKATPIFSLGNDTTICENLEITLTGPPNMFSYTWNNVISSNQTFSTNQSKVHTLSVVDSFGCLYSDDIQVLTNPSSKIDIGRDTSFCQGLTIEFFGPSFFKDYKWNGISTSKNSYSTNSDTVVFVETYNSFGCPAYDTVQINYFDVPEFSLGSDTGFCDNVDYQLIGPPNMEDYLWYNGTSSDRINVKGPGLYYLEVSNDKGCSFSDSINIYEYDSPVISIGGDTALRTFEPLTLTPGPGFASYMWSTGETSESIKVLDKNTYSVTVTDANGCTGFTEMSVTSSAGNYKLERSQIGVSPIPADDIIYIDLGSTLTQGQISITNIYGQELIRTDINKARTSVDVSILPAGTYKLTFSYLNQVFHRTIVINR
jgi:hypothetical protein